MAEKSHQELTFDDLKRLATGAGLQLPDSDLQWLYPEVARYLMAIRRLRDLDIGDIEPATIFWAGGSRHEGH